MSTLEHALTSFFQNRPQFCQSGTLVVGLSGGRDSLALLHWMAHAKLVQSNIVAVYVDHGLRAEAMAEGETLAQLVKGWGVEYRVEKTDLTPETFSENAGRMARYRIFETVAEQVGANVVCTGHHAGDQAETVLLHLLRGSGLTGLTGMRADSVRGSVTLIRPMLWATPEMIEPYAAEHRLDPIEDPSNIDQRFARNRIRHDLLPKLAADYNPQIRKNLSQMAHILQDDWDALLHMHQMRWEMCEFEAGDGWCSLHYDHWRSASVSFQRYALRNLYAHLHQSTQDLTLENLEAARIGLLEHKPDKQYQLSSTVTARFISEKLVTMTPHVGTLFDVPQVKQATLSIDPLIRQQLDLAGCNWQLLIEPLKPQDVDLTETVNDVWLAFITVEDNQNLIMRRREMGESFQPFGMMGKVALKKLMIDRKIPAFLRDQWPVIADDLGALWLPGHRLAARAAITDQTKKLIKLTFIQNFTNS